MLTVKIRNKDGNENIIEATSVEWIEKPTQGEVGHIMPGVLAHLPNGGCSEYLLDDNPGMTIWVMNRAGATVSNYIFGER
jgi:hypothetical protein